MDQLPGIKVDPVLFLRRQFAVGGDLHRRHKAAVRRAASGAKQHHMTAGAGQRAGGDRVVARRAQQIQTMNLQALAVAQDIHHLAGTRFLSTAQRLIFQGGDPPGFVTRGRVFVNRLVVCDKVLLKVIDHGHQLVEGRFVTAVTHQQLFSTEHLRHFGQHGGAAVGDHIV